MPNSYQSKEKQRGGNYSTSIAGRIVSWPECLVLTTFLFALIIQIFSTMAKPSQFSVKVDARVALWVARITLHTQLQIFFTEDDDLNWSSQSEAFAFILNSHLRFAANCTTHHFIWSVSKRSQTNQDCVSVVTNCNHLLFKFKQANSSIAGTTRWYQ